MLDKSEAHKASAFGAWELPEELQQLRETARRFMVNEVKPVDDSSPHDAVRCAPEDLKVLQAKAKKLGLWMMRTPAEHGGAGLNLLGQAIVAEEAAHCRMGAYIPALRVRLDPPNVIFLGTRTRSTGTASADRRGQEGLRRDQRSLRRLRSRPRDPLPRGA